MAGQSELWVVAILLVPIELVLAVVLSKMGISNVLPLAGIVNVVVVVPAMIVSKKNLLKMLILSILYTPIYLLVSSSFAPYATELAKATKAIEIPTGQMITYFGVEAPFFRWAVANGLAAKIPGIIALVFFELFYIFVKNMKRQNQ